MMRSSAAGTWLITATLLASQPAGVRAGTVFDNTGLAQDASALVGGSGGSGLGAIITASSDVPITGFEVFTQFTNLARADFFIADDATHQVLYDSGPIDYDSDGSITGKSSPALSFTLRAGKSYDLGLAAVLVGNGRYTYAASSQPFTEDGIRSATTSAIYSQSLLSYLGSYGGDPLIIITGAAAVPEPSSLVLLGLGGAAVLVARRLRHRAGART